MVVHLRWRLKRFALVVGELEVGTEVEVEVQVEVVAGGRCQWRMEWLWSGKL